MEMEPQSRRWGIDPPRRAPPSSLDQLRNRVVEANSSARLAGEQLNRAEVLWDDPEGTLRLLQLVGILARQVLDLQPPACVQECPEREELLLKLEVAKLRAGHYLRQGQIFAFSVII